MSANLTEAEFSQHIGTSYQVKAEPQNVELKLVEAKGYMPGAHEQQGMERFSVFFEGPPEVFLPQNIYYLVHESMGEFELFLVPIANKDGVFRYEAVFNYVRK